MTTLEHFLFFSLVFAVAVLTAFALLGLRLRARHRLATLELERMIERCVALGATPTRLLVDQMLVQILWLLTGQTHHDGVRTTFDVLLEEFIRREATASARRAPRECQAEPSEVKFRSFRPPPIRLTPENL